MKNKVLIIGLDGATWKILKKMLKSNDLPFLNSIVNKGSSGTLKSTIPSISGPSWVSFYTGMNPGNHNVYDFFDYSDDRIDPPIIDSRNNKATKMWDYLGRLDKDSLLINAPVSYPPTPLNGRLITSFLTPLNARFTYPKSLESRLKQWGYDLVSMFDEKYKNLYTYQKDKKSSQKIISSMNKTAKQKVKIFKKLYNEKQSDLSFVYFNETDMIQHLFYDQDETKNFYKKIDKYIKQIVEYHEKLSKHDQYVFILSDHGFHEAAKTNVSVYAYLDSFLKKKNNLQKEDKKTLLKSTYKFLKRFEFIKKIRNKVIKKRENNNLKNIIDMKGYFITQHGLYFTNEISSSKKEKIKNRLFGLMHNNKKVFKKVSFREDIYNGQFIENAPDIVWINHPEFIINTSPIENKIFSSRETSVVGEHFADDEGIFIAKGKNIKRSKDNTYSITDILPTVISLFDNKVPLHFDGKVMKNIFKQNDFEELSEKKYINNLVNNQFVKVRK